MARAVKLGIGWEGYHRPGQKQSATAVARAIVRIDYGSDGYNNRARAKSWERLVSTRIRARTRSNTRASLV